MVIAQGSEWATIVPASVSAVAAAFGAMAAWRAAAASARTSRDAAEALAIALKPSMDVQVLVELTYVQDKVETPIVTVANASPFDAKDVKVDVELDDGKRARAEAERLKARPTRPGEMPDILRVVLPVDLPIRPPINEPVLNRVKTLHVFYSDDRNICRYDLCWRPSVTRTANGWGREVVVTEEKISGPR